jgi:hypothetical protein
VAYRTVPTEELGPSSEDTHSHPATSKCLSEGLAYGHDFVKKGVERPLIKFERL